ncbi:MAG: hypothetical protein ACOCZM_02405 [Bacillota bacterium]
MPLKLLGAVLVLISGSATGWLLAAKYQARVRSLRRLQTAVNMLDSEIRYSQTLLSRALLKTAAKAGKPAGELFQKAGKKLEEKRERIFSQVWTGIIEDQAASYHLTREDQEILLEWGQQLGGTSLADSGKVNDIAIKRLQEAEARARSESEKKVKLLRYSGVLISLLMVILFY